MDKENKVLETIEINSRIPKVNITDDGIDFNGIALCDYHSQDCCENVYADWSAMQDYVEQIEGKKFKTLTIKAVDEMGLLLCFDDVKVLIPCHNEQNGYYSGDLELQIERDNIIKKIDVSDFVKDNIC